MIQIKYDVGILALVGAGFGLTGSLGARLLIDGDGGDPGTAVATGIFMMSVFIVMALSGPILGVFTGLQISQRTTNTRESLITAFTGGTVGYIAMTVVAVIITTVATRLHRTFPGPTSHDRPRSVGTTPIERRV